MYISINEYYTEEENGFEGSYDAYLVDTFAENLKNFLNKEVGDNGSIYHIIRKEVGHILIIKNLNIDEKFQGQGYGSELLNEIIENARSKGVHHAILLCDLNESQKDNFNLVTFYENHGFNTLYQPHDCPLMFYPEHTASNIKKELGIIINNVEKNKHYNKILEKEDIINWLTDYGIKNYRINDNLTVDVDGDVDLSNKNLTHLPVQFGTVTGSFMCQNNELPSLNGTPHTVGRLFNCNDNSITSLEYGPKTIGTSYGCSNNLLTSLKGCPKNIPTSLNCSNNSITTLQEGPEFIGDYFSCNKNNLSNLQGCPQNNMAVVDFSDNKLTSLEGAPPTVFQLILSNNLLTSLQSPIVSIESKLNCENNPIISLEGCTTIIGNNFSHKINTNDTHDLIKEFANDYTYNLPNTFILNISANQFNAVTQSQHLENILPNKKEVVAKNKI